MISNYLKLALRNLAKYRLYAFINITGLALGLTIYIFGSILVTYENNHDHMFSQREHIFTVGSVFSPNAGTGILEYPNVRMAYGPLFATEIEEAPNVVRVLNRVHLLTIENNNYYQNIRFAETGFTDMFDFIYIHGDKRAIDNPKGLILTASTAKKLFNRIDVVGEVISLDHKHDMHIVAIIEDVAPDTHFNSSFLPDNQLTIIASLETLANIGDFKMEGDWKDLNPYDMTYILLPENRNQAWLQDQVNAVSQRHAPADEIETISALKVRPLIKANTLIWDAFGFPVLESAWLLSLLILIIACLNYTNLATAQSFGRSREVGLRKTLGATKTQLLAQFLTESMCLAVFSMILSVACIELLIPVYNGLTGKMMILQYIDILPWLLFTTLTVGLLAGAYPAYQISRLSPIDSLHNTLNNGHKGSRFRSFMIAAQFSISIFMLAMVLIIYFQNQKMKDLSTMFLKTPTVILDRMNNLDIRKKHETLRQELKSIPGVQAVAFSSGMPFALMDNTHNITATEGDETIGFDITLESIDFDFIDAYDIELIAGRPFHQQIANDVFKDDNAQVNVILNQLAAEKLGFGRDEKVIGKTFYQILDERHPQARAYTIIGLMKDVYYNGTHSEKNPMGFYIYPELHGFASIKVNELNLNQTLKDIDTVWNRVIENYPIRRTFLDFYFNLFFRFPQGINNVLAAFSAVALSLALFGLYGLAAFMAQRRTKEIGVRKVMGANVSQIVRLLIWQFSQPVLWSLLVAIPSSYLASRMYLDFFPERFNFMLPVIILASLIGILTAWIIIASHAIKIARAKPIKSLRYE